MPEHLPRQVEIDRAVRLRRGDAEGLLENRGDVFAGAQAVVPLDEVTHHLPLVEAVPAPVGTLGGPSDSVKKTTGTLPHWALCSEPPICKVPSSECTETAWGRPEAM